MYPLSRSVLASTEPSIRASGSAAFRAPLSYLCPAAVPPHTAGAPASVCRPRATVRAWLRAYVRVTVCTVPVGVCCSASASSGGSSLVASAGCAARGYRGSFPFPCDQEGGRTSPTGACCYQWPLELVSFSIRRSHRCLRVAARRTAFEGTQCSARRSDSRCLGRLTGRGGPGQRARWQLDTWTSAPGGRGRAIDQARDPSTISDRGYR